eukprot:6883302-Lingulodinium_polyedra.AAC.1
MFIGGASKARESDQPVADFFAAMARMDWVWCPRFPEAIDRTVGTAVDWSLQDACSPSFNGR